MTGATDPWRDVGSGMRLDGGRMNLESNNIEGLTEEEMLQMALAASLDPSPASSAPMEAEQTVELTAEPPAGAPGTTRIQFRLPNGKRIVRRFLENDLVGMVYAFVENEAHDNGAGGKRLDLRSGFPPKDLQTVRNKTIAEAKLSGEAVQCRYA